MSLCSIKFQDSNYLVIVYLTGIATWCQKSSSKLSSNSQSLHERPVTQRNLEMPPPPESDSAGSTQQITSLTLTTIVPPPGRLELKGNLSENWKQVWDAYKTVTKLNEKESRFRVATFITCIGPDTLEVHIGLPFRSDEEKQDINVILNLWKSHCIGQTNVIYKRYKFNTRRQEPHELIDVYAAALRALAATCEFGELKDEMICDRLVCGIADNSVRRKLLQEPKLLLEKCLDICRQPKPPALILRPSAGSHRARGLQQIMLMQ